MSLFYCFQTVGGNCEADEDLFKIFSFSPSAAAPGTPRVFWVCVFLFVELMSSLVVFQRNLFCDQRHVWPADLRVAVSVWGIHQGPNNCRAPSTSDRGQGTKHFTRALRSFFPSLSVLKSNLWLQERVKSVFHAKEFGKIINFESADIAKVSFPFDLLPVGFMVQLIFFKRLF